MDAISRRGAIRAAAAAGIGLWAAGGDGSARAAGPAAADTPLAEAIRRFNARAAEDVVGKAQPPLTEDEVVAAVRWALGPKDEGGAKNLAADTLRDLGSLAESGAFPADFELEKADAYEPDDKCVFAVWSVRIRVPSARGGTTCVTIREQMIGSRLIGDAERAVIAEWREKERARGGIGSFERADWMRAYREARDEAIARDRAGRGPR